MKNLIEALIEYKSTNKAMKPLLCLNQSTGLYLVTIVFSRRFCEVKGLKVIL